MPSGEMDVFCQSCDLPELTKRADDFVNSAMLLAIFCPPRYTGERLFSPYSRFHIIPLMSIMLLFISRFLMCEE